MLTGLRGSTWTLQGSRAAALACRALSGSWAAAAAPPRARLLRTRAPSASPLPGTIHLRRALLIESQWSPELHENHPSLYLGLSLP